MEFNFQKVKRFQVPGFKFQEKGVSLILTIIILSIILAIVLGLGAILVGQIRTIREMGNSVIALYAADTGVERVLKITLDYVKGDSVSFEEEPYSETMDNNASYNVKVVCCIYNDTIGDPYYNPDCYFTDSNNCPSSLSNKEDCLSSFFCIRSVGTYGNTKRAIEVEVFPVD